MAGTGAASSKLARVDPALDRVEELIRRIAEHGFSRATAATVREIRQASQIAHHARLVRIERELEGLASTVEGYLARDPLGQPRQMMASVNRIWLLARRTRAARIDAEVPADLEPVAGIPRRTYLPVDAEVPVVPIAASGWVTASGFAGVTIELWSPDRGAMSASMVRPVHLVRSDPRRLLSLSVSQATPTSIRALCHGAWTLGGVKMSSDARVSLSSDLVALPAPIPGRSALDPIAVDSASAILDRLQSRGLDPISGLGSVLAYLEPVSFGEVRIDEVAARAVATVRDRTGARLTVMVPIRADRDVLIDNLSALGEGTWSPDGLVVSARVVAGGLRIDPLTVVFGSPVRLKGVGRTHLVHLTLEGLAGARR